MMLKRLLPLFVLIVSALSGAEAIAQTYSLSVTPCPSTPVGYGQSCTNVTLRNTSGGTLTLGNPSYPSIIVTSGANASRFSLQESWDYGGCHKDFAIPANGTCFFTLRFNPTAAGAVAASFFVRTNWYPASGTNGTLSGTGVAAGTAVLNIPSCPQSTIGATVSCGAASVTASGGPIIADSYYYKSGSHPNDFTLTTPYSNPSRCNGQSLSAGQSCIVADITFRPGAAGDRSAILNYGSPQRATGTLSGSTPPPYTFSWSQSGFGACTGGTGTWSYGSWAPATGCGLSTQTRTATCNVSTGSGSQSQSVVCLRSPDNLQVADSNCTNPKPAITQSCTPSTFSCGDSQPTSLSVLLTSTCEYAWEPEAWGGWSSTCSESATRSREVLCRRSDGESVDAMSCMGPKPSESETAEVLSSCTYSWAQSGFGACTGGSGTWMPGAWGPTMACGTIEQMRTVTCATHTDSGSHSQTVTCLRSDGNTVPDTQCSATPKPAEDEACTPDVEICGTSPATTQTVTLNTSCMRDALMRNCASVTSDQPFCVAQPL